MLPPGLHMGRDNGASSPMDSLSNALAGALHGDAGPLPKLQRALVLGGGGTLGSALLAEALVAGRFQRVGAWVRGTLASTLRGFDALPSLDGAQADVAFVVFERGRHSNGRDEAFVQPDPADLPALAQDLRAQGVRRLLVVVPHAPALLPHALKHGFANEAEHAVAGLGFEHLVFLRAAQAGVRQRSGQRLQRFADWWLAQLNWMVPHSDQPVRAVTVAALVVRLAQLLPAAPPGTRVLPPELLWQAALAEAPEALLSAWLARR